MDENLINSYADIENQSSGQPENKMPQNIEAEQSLIGSILFDNKVLEDLPPNQMIEYGEILPKSGKERSWFNSLPRNLKKRLSKIERNNEN